METELKCNRLTCRKPLNDKAVVTTCSHIFCVDCANELFNTSRLCPACETSLTEPDDVVVASLHPTNDYKTSVLSGLSPSTILEICSRAIAFWQYQIHQENAFQQAVVRNVGDKNAQLQKQLDNVIREANGEIKLLNNKIAELEKDLEVERRKARDLQEAARERDKEYQKLKAQTDKIKRKALLGGNPAASQGIGGLEDQLSTKLGGRQFGADLNAVVGGMDAHRIQRTPLTNRTAPPNAFNTASSNGWNHQQQQAHPQSSSHTLNRPHRQTFAPSTSCNASDRSGSANEVENMLIGTYQHRNRANPTNNNLTTGWTHNASGTSGGNNNSNYHTMGPGVQQQQPLHQRAFAPQSVARTGKFRPAVVPR